jgi:hypothetical protein
MGKSERCAIEEAAKRVGITKAQLRAHERLMKAMIAVEAGSDDWNDQVVIALGSINEQTIGVLACQDLDLEKRAFVTLGEMAEADPQWLPRVVRMLGILILNTAERPASGRYQAVQHRFPRHA